MAFTEEQLAAAFMAKLAGSTLRQIDENTTQQSSTGPATKIDPKQFLTPTAQPAQYVPSTAPQIVSQPPLQTHSTDQDPNQLTFNFETTSQTDSEGIKILRQIRDSLTELITLVKKQNDAKNNN